MSSAIPPKNIVIVEIEGCSYGDSKCFGDAQVFVLDWDNLDTASTPEIEEAIENLLAFGLPAEEIEPYLKRLRDLADEKADEDDDDDDFMPDPE